MSQECGGNVSDKNVVSVTSLNIFSGVYEAKNVVDFDRDNTYFSNNVENNWIKYDFKEKKVHPTHYSIKSHTSIATPSHLKNWVVEGSNDDSNWTHETATPALTITWPLTHSRLMIQITKMNSIVFSDSDKLVKIIQITILWAFALLNILGKLSKN